MSNSFSKNKRFRRVCVHCKKSYPKNNLLKVLPSLEIDKDQKIPARSFYIFPAKECVRNLQREASKLQKRIKVTSKLNDSFFDLLLSHSIYDDCPSIDLEFAKEVKQ